MEDALPVKPAESRRKTPKRTQLPDEVADYVRDLIMSGEARPGEFLRIERIAEAVGVSQTPVREGLLALRSEGLVDLLPRRGFMVARITPQDISDLYWVQALISGELSARAAQHITKDQLATLEDNVRRYSRAAAAGDWELTQDLGLEFHREVALAAQSNRLSLLLSQVTASMPSRYTVSGSGNPRRTGKEHPQLLAALKEGDSELARSLMTQHMVEQGARLVEFLQDRGLWSTEDDLAD